MDNMKSHYFLIAPILAWVALGAGPTISAPTAIPSLITVNAPTTVTVTVSITDPTVIANSVSLLRLAATGGQPLILGQLHDDGKGGDAVAGDHIYTLQVTFNEPVASQIQMEVSAAFRGLLKRSVSSAVVVDVR